MNLTIVFMGSPAFSVPTLEAIKAAGHRIVAVYSQPPKPAGRGLDLTPSPVNARAEAMGLAVRTPKSLRNEAEQADFAALAADVAVVVAYGLILPKPILDAPRLGCLNLHGSILPRWRGAAPIERAVMAGDAETGIEVMSMEEGLDTGPVALSGRVTIGPDETAGDLRGRLSGIGAALMVDALDKLEKGELTFAAQPAEGATYARKIDKAETRIDWSLQATEVHNRIRGLSPFPGAWCEMPLGKRLERVKIFRTEIAAGSGPAGTILDERLTIACGEGAIRLTELQKAGGRTLDGIAFQRGAAIAPGTRLP
ncbi:MAG: methionyl-tRNA formyltransferase [Ancalomicrobiaceae bacterium]|nr:methionyl-tRNA formyltransferase [Ancalomicrobiaceae bacterium]